MGSLGPGESLPNADAPPQHTPPSTPLPTSPDMPITGDAGGYSCTAAQNLAAFWQKSKEGAFKNSNPDASATAYNNTRQRLIEAALEEEKTGMCNPDSTTPNPKYEKDTAAIAGLEDISKRGITIKLNHDGSWDLSDPDTMQAAVQIGKESVVQNDADANKNKPPDSSGSGSGGG